MADVHKDVQDYYGQELKQSSDLKTDACCSKAQVPLYIRQIVSRVHPDVLARYYGCGLVMPPKLEGCRVVDLGCGSGRDVYIISSLVGAQGHVVGVDMTKEQLDVARQFVAHHTKEFGFDKPNVDFRLGKMEHLIDECKLEADSFDVVVSNCVVNLSPDKKRVLQQIFSVLKPGGEFYFSDVYSDRPIPDELRQHKVLWGECLSGALCESDLISFAVEIGFSRPVLVSKQPIGVENEELQKLLGDIKFTSCTYRMFKETSTDSSSTPSADALVTYTVPICHYEGEFQFDETTTFKFNEKPRRVLGELADMLRGSRYAENFKIEPFHGQTDILEVSGAVKTSAPSSNGCCSQGNC